jgi:polyisoprenoid-binding protein YceI
MKQMSSGVLVAVLAVVVVVAGAVWWFNTGDAEPTTDVTAPPVATTTAEAGGETPTTGGGEPIITVDASGGGDVYEITSGSTASFTLDEELRGNPVTVVAVSSIVLGQVRIDPDDLGRSVIGIILVNARDFTTDSNNRNRAIRGPILDTEAVEFIEFAPTSIDGLGGALQSGTDVRFTVTGDLTIRDITHEVTFDVTAQIDDRGLLVGHAEASVLRSDYELTIPNAPGVANVTDEVRLALDFEAAPAS